MRKLALVLLILLLALPVMAQDAPEATEAPEPNCLFTSSEVIFQEGEVETILTAQSFEMDSGCVLGQLVFIEGETGNETFDLYAFFYYGGLFYTAVHTGMNDYPELVGFVNAGTSLADGLFLYILPDESGGYNVQALSQTGVVTYVTHTDTVPVIEEQWGNCFRLAWSGQTRSLCALVQSTGSGDEATTTHSFRRTR